MIDRSVKMSPQTNRILESSGKVRSGAAIFNLVIGLIFIGWGLTDAARLTFILALGACLFVYGLFGMVQARKISKESERPDA